MAQDEKTTPPRPAASPAPPPRPAAQTNQAGVAVALGALGVLVGLRWLSNRQASRHAVPPMHLLEEEIAREEEREHGARRVLEELAAESPALAQEIRARMTRHELEDLRAQYHALLHR